MKVIPQYQVFCLFIIMKFIKFLIYNLEIFEEAKTQLSEEIVHFGYIESKQDYYDVLTSGNVCISTATHEFFGVSM